MAIITTTFTPTAELFPYTGLTQTVREQANLARAEVKYNVAGGTVPATTGGDNQRVLLDLVLPSGYAYTLLNITARIGGSDSNFWDYNAEAVFQDQAGAAAKTEIHHYLESGNRNTLGGRLRSLTPGVLQTNVGTVTPNGVSIYPGPVPRGTESFNFIYELRERIPNVIFNTDQVSPRYFADFMVDTGNNSACTFSMHASFIQYDIEQAYDYRINTPVFVR